MSENEWDLVSRGKYGLDQARYATEDFLPGIGSEKIVNGGADIGITAMKLNSGVKNFTLATESAITQMQSSTNKFVDEFSSMGADLSRSWNKLKGWLFGDDEAFEKARLLSDPEYGRTNRMFEKVRLQRGSDEYWLNIHRRSRHGMSVEENQRIRDDLVDRIDRASEEIRRYEEQLKARKDAIHGVAKQENTIIIQGADRSPEEIAEEVIKQIQVFSSKTYQETGDALRHLLKN